MSDERSFAVREFAPGDEQGILALFNRTFAIGNPDFAPRTLRHWKWAFPSNPEGHTTMVALADGAIVGTFTCMPARFRFPDGDFRMGQAVDTVIVTGCTTSGCVRATVVDAFSYGFRVLVAADCCGDADERQHRSNLDDVGRRYADIVDRAWVEGYLRSLSAA